jgi:hypothetical protein
VVSVTFEGEMGREDVARFTVQGTAGRCIPICLRPFPLPFGYWLADYLAAGFALPASYLFDDKPDVTCFSAEIRMQVKGTAVAKVSIWNDHWTPLYVYDGGHTRCGMLTEMSTSHLNLGLERHGLRLGWVVQLRSWSRPSEFEEFTPTIQREFFFD